MSRYVLALVLLLTLPYCLCAQQPILPGILRPEKAGGGLPAPTLITNSFAYGQTNSTVTTIAGTWAGSHATPATGAGIVCGVEGFTSGLTYSVVDNASPTPDTYTAAGAQHSYNVGSTIYKQNFYYTSISSGITTTTFNLSGAGSGFVVIQCLQATGVGGIDTGATGGGNVSTDSASGTTWTSSTITTTQPDWIVCHIAAEGGVGATLTAGTGFTAVGYSSAGNDLIEATVQSVAGAITPTATLSTSDPATGTCTAMEGI